MDISQSNIQLLSSQNLDDTTTGGGQCTSIEIPDGEINNLFPDISRLDRVYGNVGLRKAYVAVETADRSTYYGAHAVLTQQVQDPNVSVCFFTTDDYFDMRPDAVQRVESYLVKGPMLGAALYGNQYLGSMAISIQSPVGWVLPGIGDVIILTQYSGLQNQIQQYCRITSISSVTQQFTQISGNSSSTFSKVISTVGISDPLLYNFTGEEIIQSTNYATVNTPLSTTVAADASVYYGVTNLADAVSAGQLQFTVADIKTSLVPSAQSETAITDAGVSQAAASMTQTNPSTNKITRSLSYSISAGGSLYIGEGILPGSLSWSGGISLTDDSKGNVYNSSTIVGSIDYTTGIITFGIPGGTWNGTGSVSYIPACLPTATSHTGFISVTEATRGYVYVYNCNPLPRQGTIRIDYLSSGQWYTITDQGDGSIAGAVPSLGSGNVNFITGSVSMTLGGMPDAGSIIIIYWGDNASFEDLSGGSTPITYQYTLATPGVARGTFQISWNSDTYGIVDDMHGNLVLGTPGSGGFVASSTPYVLGTIVYSSGVIQFTIDPSQAVPSSTAQFHIVCAYGTPINETHNGENFIILNTPIIPHTFSVGWTNVIVSPPPVTNTTTTTNGGTGVSGGTPLGGTASGQYVTGTTLSYMVPATTQGMSAIDDGNGNLVSNGNIVGSINYTTGAVVITPNSTMYVPTSTYSWCTGGTFTNTYSYWPNPGNTTQQIPAWNKETVGTAAVQTVNADNVFVTTYQSENGANAVNTYVNIPKQFFINEYSQLQLVAGSVKLWAGSTYIVDVGNGFVYTGINGTTGIGTLIGTINYITRSITLTSDYVPNVRSMTVAYASGFLPIDPTSFMVFRTPGAPIAVTSLGIRATAGTGVVIEGTSDSSGLISGTGITGMVNYETGVCMVQFGAWLTDTFSTLPTAQQPYWYNPTLNRTVGSVVQCWQPYVVTASTILINCVVTSYLPLDATLLGLDPVRLPLDGKVPIFRKGNIVLIHNTEQETLPTLPSTIPSADFMIVGGTTVTFVSTATSFASGITNPVMLASTAALTAQNLYSLLSTSVDVNLSTMTYSISGSTITCTAKNVGTYGNSITLVAPNGTVFGLSGANLSGGSTTAKASGTITILAVPSAGGVTYNLARSGVSLIEIYGQPAPIDPTIGYLTSVPVYVPDANNYSVNLSAGSVTFFPSFNASAYTQPFIARNRIEDMVLATDVAITGQISISQPLVNSYPANTTQVSTVLPIGDLQARAYNQFTQQTWTSIWQDSRIGSAPLANYNFVDYPIIVTNEGAIQEEWLILFSTSTVCQVIGQNSGVLVPSFNISVVNSNLIVTNTLTGFAMFEMMQAGFGSGWAAGNCIRFTTNSANYPIWFVRTTLQAPATDPFDDFEFQIRGDSA